jgi:hypothetical protein
MQGTAAVDDIYAVCYQLDGHTVTFWCWNETQGLAPVRLQHQFDNEVQGSGLTDLMPQSGYPAIFKLLAGDVDILEIRHIDFTTYEPELGIVCDSLMTVDQNLYGNTVIGQINSYFEGSATPARKAVAIGRPGDRVEDAQQIFDDGHAARISAVDVAIEVAGNTLGVDTLANTSAEISALLADYRSLSTTERILVTYIVPGTWGGTTSPTWNTEVDSIVTVDSNTYAIDVWTAMGDPTGTNNKNLSL